MKKFRDVLNYWPHYDRYFAAASIFEIVDLVVSHDQKILNVLST